MCNAEFFITTGTNTAMGSLAAAVFTHHNPITGAVFGAFAGISFTLLSPLIEKIPDECLGSCAFARLAKAALTFFASVFVGGIATAIYGEPITLLSGVILTLAIAVTTVALQAYFYNGCVLSDCGST